MAVGVAPACKSSQFHISCTVSSSLLPVFALSPAFTRGSCTHQCMGPKTFAMLSRFPGLPRKGVFSFHVPWLLDLMGGNRTEGMRQRKYNDTDTAYARFSSLCRCFLWIVRGHFALSQQSSLPQSQERPLLIQHSIQAWRMCPESCPSCEDIGRR